MSEIYSIGEMARTGNCKVQTIRYYEQIGLLPEPKRNSGNQRIYSRVQYDRLRFIRHSRELGFSLQRIRQVLALTDDKGQSCEEVDRIAKEQLAEVQSKIKRLQGLRSELKRMISECAGKQIAECKIIQVLADHALCVTASHQSS